MVVNRFRRNNTASRLHLINYLTTNPAIAHTSPTPPSFVYLSHAPFYIYTYTFIYSTPLFLCFSFFLYSSLSLSFLYPRITPTVIGARFFASLSLFVSRFLTCHASYLYLSFRHISLSLTIPPFLYLSLSPSLSISFNEERIRLHFIVYNH